MVTMDPPPRAVAANLSMTAADGATLTASLQNGEMEFTLTYGGQDWHGRLRYRPEDGRSVVTDVPQTQQSAGADGDSSGGNPGVVFRRPVGRPRSRPRGVSIDEATGAKAM